MQKYSYVDFEKCRPADCLLNQGQCLASAACPKNLLEQEEPDEAPMLMSAVMCTACGKCVKDCPYKAVSIQSGSQ